MPRPTWARPTHDGPSAHDEQSEAVVSVQWAPRAAPTSNLIPPVEVAREIDLPETGILDLACGRVLRGLFTGPGKRCDRLGRVRDEIRLDAVHRLFDSSLLLGLEQRMVLEWIVGLVSVDRHLPIEVRIMFLQCKVILDHLRERRRCLYRHTFLRVGDVLLSGPL